MWGMGCEMGSRDGFLRSAIFTSSVASFFCSVSTSERFDTAASIAF